MAAPTGNNFSLDFSDIPSNVIPEGEYDAVIDKIEMREGKAAPYLNWEFTIVDPEYANRKVWLMTSMSPNALWGLRDNLAALGIDVSDEVNFEVEEGTNFLIEPDLVGEPCVVFVTIEQYQGQDRNRCQRIVAGYSDDDADDDEEDEMEEDDSGLPLDDGERFSISLADLIAMRKAELLNFANDHGVNVSENPSKADLVTAISLDPRMPPEEDEE